MTRRARALAGLLLCGYFLAVLLSLKSYGLTDDDDFYIPAGQSYVRWLGKALTFQEGAFRRAAIDAAFEPNHEHPPLAKYIFGLCDAAFGRWLGPHDGARVGTALFSTLIAATLLWMAVRLLGPRRGGIAGGLAALFLLLLPRFFFHSHAATLDVPVAALYVLTTALTLFAERSTRAAIASGVAFGLASATKLNGPFLLLPYLVFVLLTRRGAGRLDPSRPAPTHGVRLPPLPLALLAMAVLGPLVFLASWPWLWFDTVARLTSYVAFHLHHYGIYFLYFGTVYDKDPFAPWHAPFVMAAITVPLAISALALTGIVAGARRVWLRLCFTDGPDDDVRREGDLVLTAVLHAAVSILVVAFSGGPKYGGEKLFMPFYPFWCLLAGYGALRLYEAASEAGQARWAQVSIAAAAASALGLQLAFGPYALSEYNALAGGLRGATALGFERQYYDVAFRDLVAWLDDNAPRGARIHFLPNNWEYVRTYKYHHAAGELRRDVTVVGSEAEADLLILTHERRFSRYGADLLRYRGRPVLGERVVDGVPIWTVLKLRE